MTTAREHFIGWLRDAHGMERQAESLFDSEMEPLATFAAATPLLAQGRVRAEAHRERLEKLLEQYGSSRSAVKEAVGKVVSFAQSLSGLFVNDEPVKAALALSTFAQMKVASYSILAAAAQALGERDAESVLRSFADEESDFANDLASQLGPVTQGFLQRANPG